MPLTIAETTLQPRLESSLFTVLNVAMEVRLAREAGDKKRLAKALGEFTEAHSRVLRLLKELESQTLTTVP